MTERKKRIRRPASVRRAGPYKVASLANGELRITPTWPQFRPWTEKGGGGPGMGSRMELAEHLQDWLNAPWRVGP